jgi:hypothetical protein
VFKEEEEKELLRRFIHRLEPLYGEPTFSPTVNNIADIIVYKYFNGGLSFMDICFLRSSKFKGSLFQNKIFELEEKEEIINNNIPMLTEINEIIEKQLPQQVGEVLKKRLLKADEDAKELAEHQRVLVLRDREIFELKQSIEKYRRFDERNAALDVRENNLNESEILFKVRTLEYQLQAEKDKTEFTKDVALGLVKNTVYKKTIFDNTTTPLRDLNGNTRIDMTTSNRSEEERAD